MKKINDCKTAGILLLNILMAIFVMFPIIYAVCITFKPPSEVFEANFFQQILPFRILSTPLKRRHWEPIS